MSARTLSRPLVFAAACFAVVSSAVAQTSGAFRNFFYYSDGTTVTITGHAQVDATAVDVPSHINGLPVRNVASLALAGGSVYTGLQTKATTVTLPEGITTIGPNVFAGFTALKSVALPFSLMSLGSRTFAGCTSLESATFGNGVTALDKTFEGCTKLKTVDLPDHLVSLTGTFSGCSELTTIQIPVTAVIGQGTFKNCSKLASIVLPTVMTEVAAETFSGCTALQSVVFPEGLVSIGPSGFRECSGLTTLNLPSTLTTIGEYAFFYCTGLTTLNLPPSLTSIGDCAFYNCPGLTSLIFPPSLTMIGGAAFQGCTGLSSLIVPNTVTTIGDNAFWACVNLTQVQLPPRFLASIANLGLDYEPQLAADVLVDGLAKELTSSPEFISKLADAILAKSGNYGLSTKEDITNVVNQTPQTVREVIAEMGGESPIAHGITSDLGTLTVKKGKDVLYAVTTSFTATAFSATGLPDGVTLDPMMGVISGKARSKVGVYYVFLHASGTNGGVVSAMKTIIVTP